MRGKRFATPTGGDRAMRQSGHTQLHHSSNTSPSRWKSPGVVPPGRGAQEERHASHARTSPQQHHHHHRLSGQQMLATALTPERRPQTLLSNSTRSSLPGNSVHHMLTELVDLSHSIAALLEQESLSPTPARTPAAKQQEAGLKTQEIERIVRRVEAHFVDRIQTLEAKNAALAEETRQLRAALQAQPLTSTAHGAASHDVRGGLQEEFEALDELEQAWSADGSGHPNGAPLSEAEQLRRVLLAEKRQRLRVEEQTQLLTEQHAKVVGTLERRLKKQEEQLYDLIAAIDRGYSGGGPSASPTRSTERGSSHRLPTPRHLLRQQLAQHQQTQRALEEYKQNLRFEPPSPVESDEAAAMAELGLDDVRRTLESIRSSKPATVPSYSSAIRQQPAAQADAKAEDAPAAAAPHHEEPEILYTAVTHATDRPAPPPPPSAHGAPVSRHEVDEITSFLDNITKELESLDGV